jgi:drug/metabolite transporter (DMT)-like permease
MLSLIVFFLFERSTFSISVLRSIVSEILYLGLLSTGLCFFLQSWAQRRLSPTRTAVILSCEGLFGGLFSVLWGYDSLTANFVLGGSIILISVILVQIEPKSRIIPVRSPT